MADTATYDIVAIQNIDDEDFVFEYDKSQGNYPHVMRAGEVKRYPRFLAEHALKHLIDQILNKRKEKTNNQVLRRALAEKIVIDEEVIAPQATKTGAEELQETVDKLNAPSELETVLKKNREAKAKATTVTPKEEAKDTEEKFEGLPVEDTTDEDVLPEPEKVKPIPTKAEIFAYARDKMGMEFAPDQMKKMQRMTVDQLLKEVADPREDLTNG